ncbi:MAG: hypothetical protein R3C49_18950 [Planctomycetaceae bacterium]
MGPSSDLPPKRRRTQQSDQRSGKPNRHAKSSKQKTKKASVAHAWWEDWRWLTGIAAVVLTIGLAFIISRSRVQQVPDVVAPEQPQETQAVETVMTETIAPLSAENSERAIAESVLALGGAVRVVDGTDAVFYATEASQLPDVPVRVIAAHLNDLPQLTDADLQKLGGCLVIQELLLDRSPITDEALRSLKNLSTLKRLSLEETSVTEAGLSVVGNFRQLENLTFSCPVTDAGLSELRNLKQLQGLRFSGPGATDTGLRLICDTFENLTHLTTDELALTDAGIEPLSQLKKLRLLGLIRAPVSDDCIDRLSQLSTLTHLLIPGTQITSGGTGTLRKQLPNCRIFGGNFDPARFLAARIILEGGRVTVSVCDGEQTVVSAIDEFPEGNLKYHVIDLSGVQTLQRGSLTSLFRWKKQNVLRYVRKLSLANSNVSPHDIDALPSLLDGLQSLDLSGTAANDSNYEAVNGLRWMTDTLNIEGTQFSADKIAHLRMSLRGGCRVLNGGTVDWDEDRKVAEWVLSVGGSLFVDLHGPAGEPLLDWKASGVAVNRIEQLPAKPFFVREIGLSDCQSVRDDDFSRLVPLRRLVKLNFPAVRQRMPASNISKKSDALVADHVASSSDGRGHEIPGKLPHVDFMHLLFDDISAEGIRNFGFKPSMNAVILSGEKIDDEAVREIVQNMPNLSQPQHDLRLLVHGFRPG